jgi:hypothetical protein
LRLAREYRKLQAGVKLLSMGNLRLAVWKSRFFDLRAQALAPTLPQQLIHRWQEEVGLTTFSFTFDFGGMPQAMALKDIRPFAERVMPALDGV